MRKWFALFLIASCVNTLCAQPWVADKGDGTYKNPILYADYSDPDVIRVNDDYYMVASSFTCMPGLPILHSKDLVNWTLINYVYQSLPLQRYVKPQHGQGSWAPSIRHHNGKYYVYFCTPQDGLFVAIATHPAGKWELTWMHDVANWEDPCPFWDDDGKAYLLRGRVGAGPAILHRLSVDGKKLLDNGTMIYENAQKQPTLEGFKFMDKREGWYYFAAPAGGVATGWQSVFRSKNIYGPYEDKIVLHQGSTSVNGPHQGGFVSTPDNEWWFLHFQDKDAYGRIVHLQPVTWKNGWPVPGNDADGDGIGEPVSSYSKPISKSYPVALLQTSDEFATNKLGLQWQWQAAPQKNWYSLTARPGFLRLYSVSSPSDGGSLFFTPNILLQKFTSPSFTVTTKIDFGKAGSGIRAGLTVFGNVYTTLCVEKNDDDHRLVLYEGRYENRRYLVPKRLQDTAIKASVVWFRATVRSDAGYTYSYSFDGNHFTPFGSTHKAEKGIWVGAKVGVYCLNPNIASSNKAGYADVDFVQVE